MADAICLSLNQDMDADILIVGAGIAGLRCGIRLLQQRPKAKILILEKYKYLGGRVVTYHKELEEGPRACRRAAWENGAGRVYGNHKKVHALLKHYGLHTVLLGSKNIYIASETGVQSTNQFEVLMTAMLPLLDSLPASTLATSTLKDILEQILGRAKADKFLLQFPYRAEVDTLRADLGIEAFKNGMATHDGYHIIQEGLSSLIDAMVDDFKNRGGKILNQHTVVDIRESEGVCNVITQSEGGKAEFHAPKVIFALHSNALQKLPPFHHWKLLQHLRMEPLLRTYAVFPTEAGKSWFSDIPKMTTDSPVRFFIPIDPRCGVAMISYTDGKDARRLMRILDKYGDKSLEQYLIKQLRALFPERHIPDPLFFKAHPWTSGCTYWLPGHYDPKELSEKALHPFPRAMPSVFVCGESFSLRQAWMEGALEHADRLIDTYFRA